MVDSQIHAFLALSLIAMTIVNLKLNFSKIKQSNVVESLHSIFSISICYAALFTPTPYLNYVIMALSYVILFWTIYGGSCFLGNLEAFSKCTYDKDLEHCNSSNTSTSFLDIKMYHNPLKLLGTTCFLLFAIFRKVYHYDLPFISTSTIYLTIFMVCLLFGLILFGNISYEHYRTYRNKKILSIYVVTLWVTVIASCIYMQ